MVHVLLGEVGLAMCPTSYLGSRQLQAHPLVVNHPFVRPLPVVRFIGTKQRRDFPGGSVVGTTRSHCRGLQILASLVAQLVKNPPVMQET